VPKAIRAAVVGGILALTVTVSATITPNQATASPTTATPTAHLGVRYLADDGPLGGQLGQLGQLGGQPGGRLVDGCINCPNLGDFTWQGS
jgi:hypothetical protein